MPAIEIDSTLLGEMIGASVMNSITQDQRDMLVKAAVVYLLTPEKSPGEYVAKASPLQKAFNNSVYNLARVQVEKDLAADGEFAAMIKDVIAEAVTKAMTGTEREKLVEKVADAITEGFGPRY